MFWLSAKPLIVALFMLGSPSIICLDEPTSGLDSTAATALIQTLRQLADSGKTIIAVIHQPSQHVFAKFDDILLVSGGKQMYFGPRQEVRSYMEASGCRAVHEVGTAEHILDCISPAPIGGEAELDAIGRLDRLATKARRTRIDLGLAGKQSTNGSAAATVQRFTSATMAGIGPKANLLVQFKLLSKRSLQEISRAKVAILLTLAQQISTALIYGSIYSLGTNQASIQDRFGLLSLIAIRSMNMGLARTVRTFPREKAIVSNEIASNMYRTLPYFIGKAMSELPMTGFFNGLFGIVVYKLTGLSTTRGKLWNFVGLLTLHGVLAQAAGLFIAAINPTSDVALALLPALFVLSVIFDVSAFSRCRPIGLNDHSNTCRRLLSCF
jgi:ABC-2 type transporter